MPDLSDPAGTPSRKHRVRGGHGLWLAVLVLLLLGLIHLASGKVDPARFFAPANLWTKLGLPILRSLVYISLGLLAGQMIESLGWTARLGRLARPILDWARLPDSAGAAFTAAFISGVLANTLLLTGWREGRLDKRGLYLANLLCNSLPVFFLHLPTTLFIALSLTGRAGLLYLAVMFLAASIRLLGVTAVSRAVMPPGPTRRDSEAPPRRSWKEVWAETWPKFIARLKRLAAIIVPVYAVVALLVEMGFFAWLRRALTGWVAAPFLPVEAMGLIVFAVMAEFTSGFAAAGALLESGALTVKEVVLTLLLGNVVATPIRALRHQMPQYMGIYSPAVGLKIILLNQSVRVASVVLAALLFTSLY
ncbi:MAG: nucleoside recognition protein [Thermodesulfobacteriota bacterium]